MLRGEAQGRLQGLEPGVHRLTRQPVHQIEPQVIKTRRPDQLQGRPGLPGRVPPLQEDKLRFVKGLHPQAQPIEAQFPAIRNFSAVISSGLASRVNSVSGAKFEMPAQAGWPGSVKLLAGRAGKGCRRPGKGCQREGWYCCRAQALACAASRRDAGATI